jgi:hypothetical protein
MDAGTVDADVRMKAEEESNKIEVMAMTGGGVWHIGNG